MRVRKPPPSHRIGSPWGAHFSALTVMLAWRGEVISGRIQVQNSPRRLAVSPFGHSLVRSRDPGLPSILIQAWSRFTIR